MSRFNPGDRVALASDPKELGRVMGLNRARFFGFWRSYGVRWDDGSMAREVPASSLLRVEVVSPPKQPAIVVETLVPAGGQMVMAYAIRKRGGGLTARWGHTADKALADRYARDPNFIVQFRETWQMPNGTLVYARPVSPLPTPEEAFK